MKFTRKGVEKCKVGQRQEIPVNINTIRPIKNDAAPSAVMALSLLMAISALAWWPPQAQGQTLHERIMADEANDRANEIIRKARELRSMQQRPDNSGNRGENSGSRSGNDDAERTERNKQYDAVHTQAYEAWNRGDYREALRLLEIQQKLRDGPHVRADITQAKALIVNQQAVETRKAADAVRVEGNAAYGRGDQRGALVLYRRALATDPDCLTQEGKKWVRDLEVRLNAAGTMQQTIDTFAQSLSAAPSSGALDFISGDAMVVEAGGVSSGLPKSVDDAIPKTPAGNRARKGLEAVQAGDWKVALAWFQDALNQDPGDPGLRRLVDLAQFTLDYRSRPRTQAVASNRLPAQTARSSDQNPATKSIGVATADSGDPAVKPSKEIDYLADEAARKVAAAERAYAARERYNQKSGEHDFLTRMAATQMAAGARSDAAFKLYVKEHGASSALMLDRAKTTRQAYRGDGLSREELEAQFQKALFEHYMLIDGRKPVDRVGGSATAEEITLGGKG